jgi:hypothetical protein
MTRKNALTRAVDTRFWTRHVDYPDALDQDYQSVSSARETNMHDTTKGTRTNMGKGGESFSETFGSTPTFSVDQSWCFQRSACLQWVSSTAHTRRTATTLCTILLAYHHVRYGCFGFASCCEGSVCMSGLPSSLRTFRPPKSAFGLT